MEIIYGNGENFSYEFKKEKNGEKKEGIKGRGNSSWQQPKKGYSIKFENINLNDYTGVMDPDTWSWDGAIIEAYVYVCKDGYYALPFSEADMTGIKS